MAPIKQHRNRFVGIRLVECGRGYVVEVFAARTGDGKSFTIHFDMESADDRYRGMAQYLQAHPKMRCTSDMISWYNWQVEQQEIRKAQWDADRERILAERAEW
jgi:hypothetical protein